MCKIKIHTKAKYSVSIPVISIKNNAVSVSKAQVKCGQQLLSNNSTKA